jgi:hypothetical protein
MRVIPLYQSQAAGSAESAILYITGIPLPFAVTMVAFVQTRKTRR